MDRELLMLLVGVGIGLVLSLVIAAAQHLLSLRATRIQREQQRQEKLKRIESRFLLTQDPSVKSVLQSEGFDIEELAQVFTPEDARRFIAVAMEEVERTRTREEGEVELPVDAQPPELEPSASSSQSVLAVDETED